MQAQSVDNLTSYSPVDNLLAYSCTSYILSLYQDKILNMNPPNDLVTEMMTGEAETMTEEELEALQAKLEEEANQ